MAINSLTLLNCFGKLKRRGVVVRLWFAVRQPLNSRVTLRKTSTRSVPLQTFSRFNPLPHPTSTLQWTPINTREELQIQGQHCCKANSIRPTRQITKVNGNDKLLKNTGNHLASQCTLTHSCSLHKGVQKAEYVLFYQGIIWTRHLKALRPSGLAWHRITSHCHKVNA